MTTAPTTKQKKVAKLIIENSELDKPLNGGEIAEISGYSKSMQDNPKRIIDVKGVQQELKESGFTEENAKSVVSQIMLNEKAQDNNRLKAAEQVFKVTGSYAPEKKAIVSVNVDLDNSKYSQMANEFEEKLRQELLDE